mmetsp:Transcript_5097/g.11919  ORF Transcript_5097/g.11919 Transcript_5097/m.11919 type:complete len:319 (+) Transcript_5097:322-1278(+)
MHRPHIHRVILRPGAHPPGPQLGHDVLVAEAHLECAPGPELDVPVPQDLGPGIPHVTRGQQPPSWCCSQHRPTCRGSQPPGHIHLVVEVVAGVRVQPVRHQGLTIHGVEEAPGHGRMHVDSVAPLNLQAQRLAPLHGKAQGRGGRVVVAHVVAVAEAIVPFAGRVQSALAVALVQVRIPGGHRGDVNIVRRAVRRRRHRVGLLVPPGRRRHVPRLRVVARGVVEGVDGHPGIEKGHGCGFQGAPGGRLAVAAGGGGLGGQVGHGESLRRSAHTAHPLAVHHHNPILQEIQIRPQHLDRLPSLRPQHPVHPHVRPPGHH